MLHERNLPDVFENAPVKLNPAEIKRCAKVVKAIVDSANGNQVGANRDERTVKSVPKQF